MRENLKFDDGRRRGNRKGATKEEKKLRGKDETQEKTR